MPAGKTVYNINCKKNQKQKQRKKENEAKERKTGIGLNLDLSIMPASTLKEIETTVSPYTLHDHWQQKCNVMTANFTTS